MKKPVVLLVKSRSLASKLRTYGPPLGLLSLASTLRARHGAEVRVVEALFERDAVLAVRRAVRELSPDVVGISALTAEMFLAHAVIAAVKEENPGIPVVLGGPHASCDPEGALGDQNIDAAVIGEGEETFAELVRLIVTEGPRWKDPAALRGVAGLAFRADEGIELSAPRAPIQDLDSLPFPAWDLVDYRRFWKLCGMASMGPKPYLTMFTSRGCPYHCVFCHQIFGKAFRSRSPESVAEEAAQALRLGARHIEVVDDIANFSADRFDAMLQLLLDRGLNPLLSFPNALRADLLRESSLDLLKSVGAGEVSLAPETASERLQKLLNKNMSVKKAARAIEMLAERRILSRGFFMLGLPTETAAEMRETIRFARSSRLHFAMFFVPNPFPHTELHRMFREAGKLPAEVNTVDYEYVSAPFNSSAIPDADFQRLYRQAYRSFYVKPSRVFRILRDAPAGWIPRQMYDSLRGDASFSHLKESVPSL